jgi:plastocyanin
MRKLVIRWTILGALLAVGGSMGFAALLPQPVLAADPKVVEIVRNAQNNFVFSEPNITIKSGESVQWVPKEAGHTHRLMPDAPSDAFVDTQNFNGGDPEDPPETKTQTFTKVGDVHYHCFFHGTMAGTITVTPADGDK